MRLKEVTAVCGKSRAAVYTAILKGEFPQSSQALGTNVGMDMEKDMLRRQ
ncbi:AlpA family phage regulatory protein [Rugamonas sp. A1-17]|nr:AlpA family phage regulatory protein [Rugamonas sp. A1-17]